MEKKLYYGSFVPSRTEKFQVVVGTKVTDSMANDLAEIATQHDRTLSYIVRELLLRGMAAYEADGILKADVSGQHRDGVPSVSNQGSPVATRTKRPMIAKDLQKLEPTERKRKIG